MQIEVMDGTYELKKGDKVRFFTGGYWGKTNEKEATFLGIGDAGWLRMRDVRARAGLFKWDPTEPMPRYKGEIVYPVYDPKIVTKVRVISPREERMRVVA